MSSRPIASRRWSPAITPARSAGFTSIRRNPSATPSGAVIRLQSSCCTSRSAGIEDLALDRGRLARFGKHVAERWDVVVPFDERRDATEAGDGAPVELPDAVADSLVVRVEQVAAIVTVAGEVDLADATGRNAVD